MSGQPELPFSDYIVFIDESGDHGLANVDPNYPMFVLALCVFRKQDYIDTVCPVVQQLKFRHWGHDSVVLHEHDIRKPSGPYSFLFNPARRQAFMEELNALIESAPFTLIASVVRKHDLLRSYVLPANPYHLGLEFGLERLYRFLEGYDQADRLTHVNWPTWWPDPSASRHCGRCNRTGPMRFWKPSSAAAQMERFEDGA